MLIVDVVNISILVFGLTYLWANAGVVLFAESDPLDFGNLGSSFFSLFIAITQIGWADSLAHLEVPRFNASRKVILSLLPFSIPVSCLLLCL